MGKVVNLFKYDKRPFNRLKKQKHQRFIQYIKKSAYIKTYDQIIKFKLNKGDVVMIKDDVSEHHNFHMDPVEGATIIPLSRFELCESNCFTKHTIAKG